MPDAATTAALLYKRAGDLVTPSRQGVAGEPFRAFLTAADLGQLDGAYLTTTHALRYPSAAAQLREGDQVEHAGAQYRVLEPPRRVADGHETVAVLKELPQ